MALDARDLDGLVNLFVSDVRTGHAGVGRQTLKEWFDVALRNFYRSIHQIVGSTIDLIDDTHANGATYCRAEHEDANGWYVMAMRYDDEFEQREGRWYFRRRRERIWYATDILERPGPEFVRWPGHEEMRAALPQHFETWSPFWEDADTGSLARITSQP
jgi:SnoaL-like domain